jgi:ribulose-phosphate 3-epimerase
MNAPGCEYALYVLSLDHRGFGSPALAENQQGFAVDVDQVLVMTVNSGFGHQHFLHSTLGKIHRVRRMIDRLKPGCDLEVDAGIDAETAQLCAEAGANVLVAGTPIFGTDASVTAAVSRLRARKE